MLSKLALLLIYAIPIAFVPAFLLRGEGDVSIGPNFGLLGLAGFLTALVVTIVIGVRQRHFSWPWAGAALTCLATVLIAFGAIDFRGFAGGGH